MTRSFTNLLSVLASLSLLLGAAPAGIARAGEAPGQPAGAGGAAAVETRLFLPALFGGRAPAVTGPSMALIGRALEEGRIDYPTSLRYRAYAWFEDPRLPEEFVGLGPAEDLGLSEEIRSPLEPLTPAVRAELDSFAARPDSPGSVFNAGSLPAAGLQSAADLPCDANRWAALVDPSMKIRVHARCTGGYEADIRYVLDFLKAHVPAMHALMGAPLPDRGGELGGYSSDIDFYLLDPLDEEPRQYPGGLSGVNRHGLAPSDLPASGNKSSGYVLLKRNLLYDDFMPDVMVHEYFHVLQFAHNKAIFFKQGNEWWFGEASATWAQTHFLQPTANDHVHLSQFLAYYRPQKRPLGLAASYHSGDQPLLYAQYMWPLFMEMEKGPQAIAQAWVNLESTTDWLVGMDKISLVLPFDANFRRFAQRNLNLRLGPGEGVITPRYKDLNAPTATFPDGLSPIPEAEELDLEPRSRAQSPLEYQTGLPALRPVYYHFSLAPEANKLLLDLSPMAANPGIQVDAVVRDQSGDWEIRPLALGPVELCGVRELWLIASYIDLDYTRSAGLEFSLQPLTESCQCTTLAQTLAEVDHFEIEMAVHYQKTHTVGDESVSTLNEFSVTSLEMNPVALTEHSALFRAGTFAGTATIDWLHQIGPYFSALQGSGLPIPYRAESNDFSRLSLHFDLRECTYNFNASMYVDAVSTSDNSSPLNLEAEAATVGSGALAVPENLVLSGSSAFPAHSAEYIESQPDIFNFFAQYDYDLLSWLGEHGMGSAEVTWSFTPVFGP